jgi:hypothetical protein
MCSMLNKLSVYQCVIYIVSGKLELTLLYFHNVQVTSTRHLYNFLICIAVVGNVLEESCFGWGGSFRAQAYIGEKYLTVFPSLFWNSRRAIEEAKLMPCSDIL